MGRLTRRAVEALAGDLVLAPERYDPRRALDLGPARTLGELVAVSGRNVRPATDGDERPVLVLDTSHAFEGHVLVRGEPVAPSTVRGAKRDLRPGDVLVSRLRPYLRQVAYVDAALFERAPGGNAVVASTEFYVLRGRDGFSPAALVPFLLSAPVQAALAAAQEGGHHPRVGRRALTDLPVPAAWLAGATGAAGAVRARAERLRACLDEGDEAAAEAAQRVDEAQRTQ
ncbi:MAG: hypothetical protein H6704_10545 [Myxococcales bacterium]|nr:hypothetical protein [Myxococcales bacterium]